MLLLNIFDYRNPDWRVLPISIGAFILAFVLPLIIEQIFGYATPLVYFWEFLGIAFHEIGHVLFGALVSPIFRIFGPVYYLAEPLHYLGAYLFNAIAGLALLAFSLFAESRISSGRLSEKTQPVVFSFMFLAYVNLYFVNWTLTHLSSVVGRGLDFTMTSLLVPIPLPDLIFQMWIVHWVTYALAILLNFYFIFRRRRG